MNNKTLKDYIQVNSSFKTAVNLYLSLNKTEKVLSYIPTKASSVFLKDYIKSVINNKEQASLLVGPYGKGKSHLLLVLLAILSLERNEKNQEVIQELCEKFEVIDDGDSLSEDIKYVWNNKRFLPVIINNTSGDLNQAFLTALHDALKREGLEKLSPDTYFSLAFERINSWKKDYPETFSQFVSELKRNAIDPVKFVADLKRYSKNALNTFIEIYPKVTAGSVFNPLAASDVLPLYKSVSEKLVEEYEYSGIYIVFDEFSKFIEGLDRKNVGNDMKLIQDMCELANDSSNSQIHFTMVTHKSIKEYGKYLSIELINAFTGIEGRIIEKFFVTSSKNNYELIKHAIIKDESIYTEKKIKKYLDSNKLDKYYQLPIFGSNFKKEDFDEIVLKGCYPLNPVATYLLLNVSEKVAQNERTLFTFISNDEPNSMARFISEHENDAPWILGADAIYDYFSGLFKKEVSNELVHSIWLSAEAAINKCVNDEERRVVKAIAIIQVVNKSEEIIASENSIFLSLNDEELGETIEELVKRQVIYKKGASGAYVFKTKAGTELRAEIRRQKEIKGDNINYGQALELITDRHFVIPRRFNSIHYMTRYFSHEYLSVDAFLTVSDINTLLNDRADGKVITLYSFEGINQTQIKEHIQKLNCDRLVVVVPKHKLSVQKEIKEFAILQSIRDDRVFLSENEAIHREIPLLEEDITLVVEEELEKEYDATNALVFYYEGIKLKKLGGCKEECAVNACCESVYSKTPKINNEIINRSVIATAQTKKARATIIDEIIKGAGVVSADFYAGTNQEATIYRSLFCNTGLVDGIADSNLFEILEILDKYVDECVDNKQSFKPVIDKITSAPYGMRMGVVPIYLSYILARRREDIVVYYADHEVQISADIIVNMCEKADDYSLFVSKEDHLKEKYIRKLNELFSVSETRNLTENRIKNIVICMQRWFRSLPLVTRNVANIKAYTDSTLASNMKKLQRNLQKVEFNSYEILFSTLPKEFDTKSYEKTYKIIEDCKNSYDAYLEWMMNEIINVTYEIYGGKRKLDLYHLLKEWYEKQSGTSKQGLLDGRVTNYMSCLEKLNVYDDLEVAKKVAKAVTDVYVDNWTDDTFEEYKTSLLELKNQIESVKEASSTEQMKLSFMGSKGNLIEKYYEPVDESTGSILRNILEDTLEEFDDMSVNDRVGILLEMIEKVIG
ncbi:hypothetical protein [Pseudobutyrivibrio xylanivorans]|uniref:Uncharacterized protein n=1 Tax=Pseudobutyrivibrio xylanivorans DSM 14809 TaxID=1123012 RepID=A0A1M6JVT0_PSEXY|nr:hypothetical protein [Pseudobutyrivibrio xylanivorans]SHJ50758.1 hypothetical protein SAMN02745725_02699 [Pseudobutyrivibrio xylanivorans DSM 14809]